MTHDPNRPIREAVIVGDQYMSSCAGMDWLMSASRLLRLPDSTGACPTMVKPPTISLSAAASATQAAAIADTSNVSTGDVSTGE